MKIMLAKYAPKSIRTVFEDLSEKDSTEAITKNIFLRNTDTLQRALDLLDYNQLNRASEILRSARKILVLGVGASATISEDFYIRLMRIGICAEHFSDSHLMQIAAGLCSADTAVFAISHTGKTREIISAVELARSCGATAIGMTGYPETPLKKSCDVCIELYSPEQLFISPRVAQVSLLDSLYVAIAIQQKQSVINNIKKMQNALTDFRI